MAMKRPKAQRKSDRSAKALDRRRPVGSERAPARKKTLGYAQDAGHPGGLQDLRVKTETEAEHDEGKRRG